MFGFDIFGDMVAKMYDLFQRIGNLEESLENINIPDVKDLHRSTEFSVYQALCVDTLDPDKQGRVRFYCPYLHGPKRDDNGNVSDPLEITSLPFAEPISAFGGFDDSGSVNVPPVGSTLLIIFEAGFTHNAYYIGTRWGRDRGPTGKHYWDNVLNLEEYQKLHEGHRKGYLLGKDDESQVLPPWNTENYNSIDVDSKVDVDYTQAISGVAFPNISGNKTPQKHMYKNVDGDPENNFRYKRMEIYSSLGNLFIMKDDPLHPSGEWANPMCGDDAAKNKYFKHKNECRPYKGPGTPQNNKCSLPQSGIQLLSISGQTIILDDSVEEPYGDCGWERSLEDFNFGSTNTNTGKILILSNTGQRFELNDEEKSPEVRGRTSNNSGFDPWSLPILDRVGRPSRNGILLYSATGGRIEISDDTVGVAGGPNRGITLQSTSNHVLEMIDQGVENPINPRKEGGTPKSNATNAYVRLRSGYGITLEMRDSNSQEKTQDQFLQLTTPQTTAKGVGGTPGGPHYIRMQEDANCGYVMVRAAGDYRRWTAGNELIRVGDPSDVLGPQSRFLFVGKDNLVDTKETYYNHANYQVFWSKTYILLAAGEDCPPQTPSGDRGPCMYPVATSKCATFCPLFPSKICLDPKSFSTRVFASTDNKKC